MAYLVRHNPDLLWRSRRNNDYGDWLSVGADTPREVLATAYLAYDAKLMARIARVLGRADREAHYERAAPRRRRGVQPGVRAARTASSRATRRRSTCWRCTWTCCRTSCARAWRSAWSPTSSATTGTSRPASSASALLCPVLTEAGYADVAYRLLLNETFPSWGYSIRHGATTIWERWDGWTEQHGFQTAADELVQPLLARLGRPVALRVRRRHPARPRAARLRARASSPPSPARSSGHARRSARCAGRSERVAPGRRHASSSTSRSRRTSRPRSSCPGGETRDDGRLAGARQLQSPRLARQSESSFARARARSSERDRTPSLA